jgi:hypothetical protein
MPMTMSAHQQAKDQLAAGERWTETGLVFTTQLGTGMNAANVRRDLRRIAIRTKRRATSSLDTARRRRRPARHQHAAPTHQSNRVAATGGFPVSASG